MRSSHDVLVFVLVFVVMRMQTAPRPVLAGHSGCGCANLQGFRAVFIEEALVPNSSPSEHPE